MKREKCAAGEDSSAAEYSVGADRFLTSALTSDHSPNEVK